MFTASFNIESLQALAGDGKDPVCGMDVDQAKAAGLSSYQGKNYYFCAAACKQQFDADPAKYVAKS